VEALGFPSTCSTVAVERMNEMFDTKGKGRDNNEVKSFIRCYRARKSKYYGIQQLPGV
jgi:hypothetical protein